MLKGAGWQASSKTWRLTSFMLARSIQCALLTKIRTINLMREKVKGYHLVLPLVWKKKSPELSVRGWVPVMNGCFLEIALRTAARLWSSVDMFWGGPFHFGGFVPFITLVRRRFHSFTKSFVKKWRHTNDTNHSKTTARFSDFGGHLAGPGKLSPMSVQK